MHKAGKKLTHTQKKTFEDKANKTTVSPIKISLIINMTKAANFGQFQTVYRQSRTWLMVGTIQYFHQTHVNGTNPPMWMTEKFARRWQLSATPLATRADSPLCDAPMWGCQRPHLLLLLPALRLTVAPPLAGSVPACLPQQQGRVRWQCSELPLT